MIINFFIDYIIIIINDGRMNQKPINIILIIRIDQQTNKNIIIFLKTHFIKKQIGNIRNNNRILNNNY